MVAASPETLDIVAAVLADNSGSEGDEEGSVSWKIIEVQDKLTEEAPHPSLLQLYQKSNMHLCIANNNFLQQ